MRFYKNTPVMKISNNMNSIFNINVWEKFGDEKESG